MSDEQDNDDEIIIEDEDDYAYQIYSPPASNEIKLVDFQKYLEPFAITSNKIIQSCMLPFHLRS